MRHTTRGPNAETDPQKILIHHFRSMRARKELATTERDKARTERDEAREELRKEREDSTLARRVLVLSLIHI